MTAKSIATQRMEFGASSTQRSPLFSPLLAKKARAQLINCSNLRARRLDRSAAAVSP